MRHRLGPLEPAATSTFRRVFFDVDAFADFVVGQHPEAMSVLEVGCGEGAVISALADRLTQATFVGIDIAPAVGRGFRGDRGRVTFARTLLADYLDAQAPAADLVVVCDVLHHMPKEDRAGLIRQAYTALRPGGALVVKEWERRRNLGNVLSNATERWVSRAAIVDYLTADELWNLIREALGDLGDVVETRLPPWRNNIALSVSRPTR